MNILPKFPDLNVLAQRLEKHSIPEPNSGCFLWLASVNEWGYGTLRWHGATRRAHRLMWELQNGPITDGRQVLHKCDNPACINPKHLRIGTNADNVADKVSKGRQAKLKGSETGAAKLTEKEVLEIRASSKTQRALGLKYGVTQSAIHCILARKCWTHIP